MKRIIKLFSLLMMLSISLTSYAHDFEVDGLGYTIISTGELTCEVSGLTNPDMKDIVIPETVTYMGRELSVIKIGKKAFAHTEIETVKLSDTISAIPYGCFMSCENLRSVSPLTSVKYFGEYCFDSCNALKNIEFNKELDNIELNFQCFAGCSSLESIVLPDNIVFPTGYFNLQPFSDSGLKKVEINCNVGDGTFSGCSSLTDVVFGSKCMEIGWHSFSDCTSLTHIKLPSSVKSLGRNCFSGCTSLETIDIQNINEIYSGCFAGCTSLETIDIHNVNYIGESCFRNCNSLKAIEYNAEEIYAETFMNCNLEMLTIGPNTFKISDVSPSHGGQLSPFRECKIKILNICPGKDLTNHNPLQIDIDGTSQHYIEGMSKYDMFKSIEELHIGRDMENSRYNPKDTYPDRWDSSLLKSLKKVTITSPEYYNPESYSHNYLSSYIPWDQLTFLKSECLTPPELPNKFTTSQYTTMEVQVPFEALDAYKNADVWKEFWNLKGYDGVDDIPADNIDDDKVEVYNLQGMRMNISSRDELCKLQPGLYIINGKKEVVK